MYVLPVVPSFELRPGAMSALPHQPEPDAQLRGRRLRFGALTLDPHRRCAAVDDRDAGLSPAEFALLHLLATRRGVPMSKEAIMGALFETAARPDPRIVDVWVLRIRSKLAKTGFTGAITTVWGRGYTFAASGEDRATRIAPIGSPSRPRRARSLVAAV
jgi:DNA-binding response OmpR family regulator